MRDSLGEMFVCDGSMLPGLWMLMTVLFCVNLAWPQTNSDVFLSGEFYRAGGDGRIIFLCIVRTLFYVALWMKGMQSCVQLIGTSSALSPSLWPIGSLALAVLRFTWRMCFLILD